MDQVRPKYTRVLLKLSGEAFAGDGKQGIQPAILQRIAEEVAAAHRAGVGIGIVPGGGNFFRGGSDARQCNLEEYTGHFMGMLGTVINGLALQGALETQGVQTRLMTAIEMREVAEPYIQRRAQRHLEKERIVIFAAGTGSPFFTTDTAAVLRSVQMNAEVILKGTNVDGVYDGDPRDRPGARLFDTLKYLQVLEKGYKVMDATAISLSMERRLPIVVFNMTVPGNIERALLGLPVGTVVS